MGDTDFAAVGALNVAAGSFVPGTGYSIVSLGDTNWATVSDSGAASVGDVFIATRNGDGTGTVSHILFTATASGSGTGTARGTIFTATGPGDGTGLVSFAACSLRPDACSLYCFHVHASVIAIDSSCFCRHAAG
jgi:hypothetical protein